MNCLQCGAAPDAGPCQAGNCPRVRSKRPAPVFKCDFCDRTATMKLFDDVGDNHTVRRVCSMHLEQAQNGTLPGHSKRADEQPRYGAVNSSRADHIRRLRARVGNACTVAQLRGAIIGLLDLLEDDGNA